METAPGPLSFAEGGALQHAILAATNVLIEIEEKAVTSWVTNHEIALQMYRLEMQPSVSKSIEVFREISPIAKYVGGPRAEELQKLFDAVTRNARSFANVPTEPAMHAVGSALVDAVRHASDLVLLGSTVAEAYSATSHAIADAQQSIQSRLDSVITTVDALAGGLRQEVAGATDRLKQEADRLADELTARGKVTVAETKKAVAGTLLTDAQQQFATAQEGLNRQVAVWAALSVMALVAFFATTARFLLQQDLDPEWTWQIAFFAGVRLVIIGGIAAVGSFCIRMLKSQIALAQLNAHRTRVARSMPGLLEVAAERDRLAVLQSLMQTIIGAKESVLSDSNPESLLATAEAIEKLLKTAKGE